MTTRTTTTPLAHSTDADFRAWVAEIIAEVTAAGLVQTADTGQVDTATVTIPGTFTRSAYAIFYLNDSLHATKPVYIKFGFGTWSTGQPSIDVTCGAGTNGSGTISGVMFTLAAITQHATLAAGNYPTFICVKDGYFGFAWKRRALSATGTAFFAVCRTTDAAGDPTSTGFYFYYGDSDLKRKTYLTTQVDDSKSFCMFPGGATTTAVGGDVQLMRHFGYQPTVVCVPFLLSFINAEIGDESTFTATPLGVAPRTYLALGGTGAPTSCSVANPTTHKLAMQYD